MLKEKIVFLLALKMVMRLFLDGSWEQMNIIKLEACKTIKAAQ